MDDLEFVHSCVNGNKQSWDTFVDKYSRLIYAYIYSILKLRSLSIARENIDDLFQEIFLSLVKDNFKKLRSFKAKNGCSLASWLRQVVINFTIDYLRKIKPTVSLETEDERGFSLEEVIVEQSLPVSEIIKKRESFAHLKDCIGRLDKEDKYFLELHMNRNLSLDDLKEHFRVSRGAVDMRKARIIDRLRDCFRSKGFALDF